MSQDPLLTYVPAKAFQGTLQVTVKGARGDILGTFSMRGGTNLWVFLRKHGHPIGASCSGVGVCGRCAVRVEKESENAVTPQSEFEKNTLQRNGWDPSQWRLACLCRVIPQPQGLVISADVW